MTDAEIEAAARDIRGTMIRKTGYILDGETLTLLATRALTAAQAVRERAQEGQVEAAAKRLYRLIEPENPWSWSRLSEGSREMYRKDAREVLAAAAKSAPVAAMNAVPGGLRSQVGSGSNPQNVDRTENK